MSKAHENIDNEIIANTLQEILHTKHGESMDILYKALTKGNEDRYIHRNVPGYPTDERRKWSGNMLRREIEQNPTFADTISYKQGMEQLAPRESILSKIKKALGRYDEGGVVGDFSEMLNEFQNLTKDYKDADKIVKAGDLFPFRSVIHEKDGKYSFEGSRFNPEQKRDDETIKEFYMRTNPYELMQDFAEGIELAIAGQTNLEDESKNGEVIKDIFEKLIISQPKHSDYGQASYTYADEGGKKKKGIMGALQRFLPGGKTGYTEPEVYRIFERLLGGLPVGETIEVKGKRR
tara:strand:+ start:362 stop:1237 length:876 start_codon:yes stop_codon:yes gene_type:complete